MAEQASKPQTSGSTVEVAEEEEDFGPQLLSKLQVSCIYYTFRLLA